MISKVSKAVLKGQIFDLFVVFKNFRYFESVNSEIIRYEHHLCQSEWIRYEFKGFFDVFFFS